MTATKRESQPKSAPGEPLPRPAIVTYDCYRALLGDFFLYKKSTRAGFTYRRFSQLAGLKSPNYLQLVIQGKRNLSTETAGPVADSLRLMGAERAYFLALVAHAGATTQKERDAAQRALLVSTRHVLTKQINSAQGEILHKWHHLVIREMTFLPDFRANGKWIAERLSNLVTPELAEESIAVLEQTGLLVRGEGGRLVSAEPVLDTGDEYSGRIESSEARRMLDLHLQAFAVWKNRLQELDASERELALINIPLARARVPEFKARMRAFQDEIIGWVQDEASPEEIFQLGLCFLPLTRK